MIAFHKARAFEEVNSLGENLIKAALAMLEVFEKLCGALRALPPGADPADAVKAALTFPKLLHEYLTAFQAWKRSDGEKMTQRIKHALSALYKAEAHLEESDPETPALRADLQGQQARLRAKLLQIAGKEAPQAVDAARAQQHSAAAPPAAGAAAQAVEGGGEGAYSAQPKRVTNQKLAHELLLDPAFTLDENGGCDWDNPVHKKIQKSLDEEFWKSVKDDLCLSQPCYARVVKVLEEVRDGIADLAKGSARRPCADKIKDVLNIESIKQRIEDKNIPWNWCVEIIQGVASILTQIENTGAKRPRGRAGEPAGPSDQTATARWEEINRAMQAGEAEPAEQPAVLCAALSYLLERVRAVRIDVANSRLRFIAPMIKDHGIEYMRNHFQQQFPKGTSSLRVTQKRLREAVEKEVGEKRIQLRKLRHENEPKETEYLAVVYAAGAMLVTGTTPPLKDDCPETLLFDVARLRGLNAMFHAIVNATAVLAELGEVSDDTTLHETVAEKVLAVPAGNKEKVVDAVVDALQGSGIEGVLTRERVEGFIKKDNSVFVMMRERLCNALRLSDDDVKDIFWNVPTTLKAYEKKLQLPKAAEPLAPHIRDVVRLLRKVMSLSARVHNAHYNDIIREIASTIIPDLMAKPVNPSEGSETLSRTEPKK